MTDTTSAVPVDVDTVTTGDAVYALTLSHRHGDIVSVFTTQQRAHASLVAYVADNWADEMTRWNNEGEQMPASDEEAVNTYFEVVEGEGWGIEAVPLNIG